MSKAKSLKRWDEAMTATTCNLETYYTYVTCRQCLKTKDGKEHTSIVSIKRVALTLFEKVLPYKIFINLAL